MHLAIRGIYTYLSRELAVVHTTQLYLVHTGSTQESVLVLLRWFAQVLALHFHSLLHSNR